MRMKPCFAGLVLATLLGLGGGACMHAQALSNPPAGVLDVAVTYAAAHAIHTAGASFWLNGGAVDVNAQFYKGFGLAGSLTGLTASSSGNGVASLDLITVTFGPSYTIRAGRRIDFRGEALLGEANGFHSLFAYGSGPTPSLTAGTTSSANSLALQTGGDVSVRLTHRLALRAVQVEYLRTQLPNGAANLQNNVRVAAGIVFRLGDK